MSTVAMVDDGHDELTDLIDELSAVPEHREAMEDAEELFRLLETLRAIRKTQKITQRQVAKTMGTTQSAVSKLEGGISDPQITTLLRYARAVNARIPLRPALPGGELRSEVRGWTGHASGRSVARPQVRPATGHGTRYLTRVA